MASAISYEYLQALFNVAEGIAKLDENTKILASQLPDDVISKYKGEYADEEALIAAYPTANRADHAYVEDSRSLWYWNSGLTTPAWVNQHITAAAYLALSSEARDAVPYIIIP